MENPDEKEIARVYTRKAQIKEWEEEADELDMSKKKYYHTVINAGRREMGLIEANKESTSSGSTEVRDKVEGLGLRDRVLSVLDEGRENAMDFDEIVDRTVTDIEEEIGDILADDERIGYHPRDGHWRK